MQNLNFLIKPASSQCNMRCRYCFYADEAAVRTLEDLQSVKLAADESRAFAEALQNPREPGPRLRTAARRYMASVAAHEPSPR